MSLLLEERFEELVVQVMNVAWNVFPCSFSSWRRRWFLRTAEAFTTQYIYLNAVEYLCSFFRHFKGFIQIVKYTYTLYMYSTIIEHEKHHWSGTMARCK